MTDALPRRDEVLRDVIAAADARLDGELPMDVPGVGETYGDAATLARVLHVRWFATLGEHVDRELGALHDDPERAVVRAWRKAARELPGVRMVLDRCSEQAQGREAERWRRREDRQRQWLAHRAGLTGQSRVLEQPSVDLGAELELAGRKYFDPHGRHRRPSLARRIRAALA